MITRSYEARIAQRGVVLVSSLLLLIVVTIIALSMFRSFGIQEKIAGNVREKQRALQAAESAQVYAEVWLTGNAGPSSEWAMHAAIYRAYPPAACRLRRRKRARPRLARGTARAL